MLPKGKPLYCLYPGKISELALGSNPSVNASSANTQEAHLNQYHDHDLAPLEDIEAVTHTTGKDVQGLGLVWYRCYDSQGALLTDHSLVRSDSTLWFQGKYYTLVSSKRVVPITPGRPQFSAGIC